MGPDLLSMEPRPLCAVLLPFPLTQWFSTFWPFKYKQKRRKKIKPQGQDVKSSVCFMKQTISNTCGAAGLTHAIANNEDKMRFEPGSTLKKSLEAPVSVSPEERARRLESEGATRATRETSAHEGQPEAPNTDEKANLPFIAFVHVDGPPCELDGRKPFPMNHGGAGDETL
ncbi:PREDICTED: ubiquitin carboxyl-terminal hydrolase isozyme L3-like [Myotis brandtii]|uniref:ubiquitin carboxyl-terminal hydrolase isozyme L3-like n=1 Tax=Myotis brandtii TaxID=109478 RepID=UPI000703D401|nr:PREDICTED: ubiquitin carboxyl-terminal hydrolase isozyme L3-like [Myotis brandtii]